MGAGVRGVKLFVAAETDIVEKAVNAWLAQNPNITIVDVDFRVNYWGRIYVMVRYSE